MEGFGKKILPNISGVFSVSFCLKGSKFRIISFPKNNTEVSWSGIFLKLGCPGSHNNESPILLMCIPYTLTYIHECANQKWRFGLRFFTSKIARNGGHFLLCRREGTVVLFVQSDKKKDTVKTWKKKTLKKNSLPKFGWIWMNFASSRIVNLQLSQVDLSKTGSPERRLLRSTFVDFGPNTRKHANALAKNGPNLGD